MEENSALIGAVVIDGLGEVIGRAQAVMVDPDSHDARWLSVALSDGSAAVLPVQAASVDSAGRLVVPYGPATVAAAPKVVDDIVTREDAEDLLRYYGFVA